MNKVKNQSKAESDQNNESVGGSVRRLVSRAMNPQIGDVIKRNSDVIEVVDLSSTKVWTKITRHQGASCSFNWHERYEEYPARIKWTLSRDGTEFIPANVKGHPPLTGMNVSILG
jgi:hypothetical protein